MQSSRPSVLQVDPLTPDPVTIAHAVEVLRARGLVAFPTETVYGLGAFADDDLHVRRIFEAKGRPAHNPLIVHVGSTELARTLAPEWNEWAERFAHAFWPGPLTLVVPRNPSISSLCTANGPSMALRVPQHPVALALLRHAQRPVAAPSANPSMSVSPTRAQHVIDALRDRIDLVLDGGTCIVGLESTVIDLTSTVPMVLRPGMISLAMLREIVPSTRMRDASPMLHHASPGLDPRHYAPRARVLVVDAFPFALSEREEPAGFLHRSWANEVGTHAHIVMPNDANHYAEKLYDSLHALDALGCRTIVVQRPPQDDAWTAIHDRLTRASHPASQGNVANPDADARRSK